MLSSVSSSAQRTSRLWFRVMLSGIFLVAGTNHWLLHDKIVGRLESAPLGWLAELIGPPGLLVSAAGVALLVGGLALALGFRTRLAAVGLMAIVIPITVTVQIGRIATLGPLFKNIGLLGGLLYFATHGPRAPSLDELRAETGAEP